MMCACGPFRIRFQVGVMVLVWFLINRLLCDQMKMMDAYGLAPKAAPASLAHLADAMPAHLAATPELAGLKRGAGTSTSLKSVRTIDPSSP